MEQFIKQLNCILSILSILKLANLPFKEGIELVRASILEWPY